MISMPLRRGLRERALERARVRHRRRDHVRLRGDRRVDARHLLRDVVVRVDLRDADAAALQVLRRLVDALLEHRPERAGVAVGDDRDLDRAGAPRAERERRGRAEERRACGDEPALDEEVAAAEPPSSGVSTSFASLIFVAPCLVLADYRTLVWCAVGQPRIESPPSSPRAPAAGAHRSEELDAAPHPRPRRRGDAAPDRRPCPARGRTSPRTRHPRVRGRTAPTRIAVAEWHEEARSVASRGRLAGTELGCDLRGRPSGARGRRVRLAASPTMSVPPSVRCPVSRQSRTSQPSTTRQTSSRVSTRVPTCGWMTCGDPRRRRSSSSRARPSKIRRHSSSSGPGATSPRRPRRPRRGAWPRPCANRAWRPRGRRGVVPTAGGGRPGGTRRPARARTPRAAAPSSRRRSEIPVRPRLGRAKPSDAHLGEYPLGRQLHAPARDLTDPQEIGRACEPLERNGSVSAEDLDRSS